MVGEAYGGCGSQGNMSVYVSARTERAVCGWKLHADSGKGVGGYCPDARRYCPGAWGNYMQLQSRRAEISETLRKK